MIGDIQHVLESLFATAPSRGKARTSDDTRAHGPVESETGHSLLTDDEVIARVRASASGDEFTALFDKGDLSKYGGDHSAADFGLMGKVRWWCRNDAGQMERIMRRSALSRGKWDEVRPGGTWLSVSIQRCIDTSDGLVFEPQPTASSGGTRTETVDRQCGGFGPLFDRLGRPIGIKDNFRYQWDMMSPQQQQIARDRIIREKSGGNSTGNSPPNPNSPPSGSPPGGNRFVAAFKKASEIKPTTVQWVWEQRIPVGRMSVIAGHGGLGKSVVTADIVARITAPNCWPGRATQLANRGSVIMMCAEDDASDTTVPRLIAAGADLDKVILLEGKKPSDQDPDQVEGFTLGITCQDVDIVAEAAAAAGDCKLIVVDPIGSYLGGQVDAFRDNEVRAVIDPLIKLARQIGAGLLVVAHVNKAINQRADDAILGSRAFTTLSRSVLHLMADPDDKERYFLAPGKMNICKRASTLAYRMETVSVPDAGSQPRLVWEEDEIQDTTADDLLGGKARPGPSANQEQRAMEWIEDVLMDEPDGIIESAELVKGAVAAGFSEATLRRAKDKLGVVSKIQKGGPKDNKSRRWYCGIGDNWEPPTIPPDNALARVGSEGVSTSSEESPQVVTGQGPAEDAQTPVELEHLHGEETGDAQVQPYRVGDSVSGGVQVTGDAQVRRESEQLHKGHKNKAFENEISGDAHPHRVYAREDVSPLPVTKNSSTPTLGMDFEQFVDLMSSVGHRWTNVLDWLNEYHAAGLPNTTVFFDVKPHLRQLAAEWLSRGGRL